MRLLHKDLTYKIRGCIFAVHNELKTGFNEESYHLALENRLDKNNISFQSKPFCFLEHRGIKVHKFIPDLIVEDKVILELKNIQSDFIPANYLQIISYLKHWQKDLGLLVNFGVLTPNIERILFSEKELILYENYMEIEDFIISNDRQHFENTRSTILNIFEIFGLGYSYSMYKSLFQVELAHQNIAFAPSIFLPVKVEGQLLKNFELKVPLIGQVYLNTQSS